MKLRAIIALAAVCLGARAHPPPDPETAYREGRWEDVVEATRDCPPCPADTMIYRGLALARLERWEEAHRAFVQGRRAFPGDPRFPAELAGVAFRLQDYGESRRRLRQALRVDSDDEYSRDFLGSLLLLSGRLDAALAVWNPLGKPVIETIDLAPVPRLDPVLLDSAIVFAPGDVLRERDVAAAERRLELLQAFSTRRIMLIPQGDDEFLVRLLTSGRRGLDGPPLPVAARVLRGVPYQTVFAERFNIRGRAEAFASEFRWRPVRRRAALEYSRPWQQKASQRWSLFADVRDERWQLLAEDGGADPFDLFSLDTGAGFDAVIGDRWGLRVEAAITRRSFAGAPEAEAPDPARFPSGMGVRNGFRLDWNPLRIPEHGVRIDSVTRLSLGRVFAGETRPFGGIDQGAVLEWRPVAFRDEGMRVRLRTRAGALGGDVPVDALTAFGVERDNEFHFRGLSANRRGVKGAAPMGERYWFAGMDFERRVMRWKGLEWSAGPFYEAGRVYDSRGGLGAQRALQALGIQSSIRALGGLEVTVFYGMDLSTGRGVFFADAPR